MFCIYGQYCFYTAAGRVLLICGEATKCYPLSSLAQVTSDPAMPCHLETNWSPSTQALEEIELAKGCSMESILLSNSNKMRKKLHSISAMTVVSAKEELE